MILYKNGTKRPLVFLFQDFLGLHPDGVFGIKTLNAVKNFQKNNDLTPDGVVGQKTLNVIFEQTQDKKYLFYKIAEMVAFFECSRKQDVFSYTSVVAGDGAGTNYGFMQQNKYGSLQYMQQNFGCPKNSEQEIKNWYGSESGIKAQMEVFKKIYFDKAFVFPFSLTDVFVALLCDAKIQGGGFYPTKNIKNWNTDWQLSWLEKKRFRKIYKKDLPVATKFLECLKTGYDPIQTYAELHPRSGSSLFLNAQLARRRCVARGIGFVNGETVDIKRFFGIN